MKNLSFARYWMKESYRMRIELSKTISMSELLTHLGDLCIANFADDTEIKAICTDSQNAHHSDLFFALNGERFNGEDYAKEAVSNGAIAVTRQSIKKGISVSDVPTALLRTASLYKSKLKKLKYTVAVTGSVGKSTVKEFIRSLLSEKLVTHATHGNYNNYIGVSHTILSAPEDTEALVIEMGMNHSGEISSLSRTAQPDICVITNIGTAHIGNLGSRENIAKAKLEILDGMRNRRAIVPYGEELLMLPGIMTSDLDSCLSDISLITGNDGSYSFRYFDECTRGLKINLNARHHLYNMMLAIGVAKAVGMSDDEIHRGVETINTSKLRQRFIHLNGYTIFDDSYNASLESIIADFRFLKSLGSESIGAFIGDILELGDSSKKIHKMIGSAATEYGLSSLYLIGNYSQYIAEGAIESGFNASRIFINRDIGKPEISINQIIHNHLLSEVILFKASHRLRLDKIADALIAKERNKE